MRAVVLVVFVSDLPEKLKHTTCPLYECLVQLLRLLQAVHASGSFSSAAAAENFMRVLVRVAPLFSKQQHHISEALSLLAGPKGVCSDDSHIAPKACLALLRFVKNCLPHCAAYTGLLLQHLLQQQCLDIPTSSCINSVAQQRMRVATPPSCSSGSRQEPLALAAAADVYVRPRAFQVEQQLLLYEAAGVLLGSKQQHNAGTVDVSHGLNSAGENVGSRVLLLRALLSKATAAFTSGLVSTCNSLIVKQQLPAASCSTPAAECCIVS